TGIELLGDHEPVGVVEAAVVGDRDRLDVDGLVVVQRPLDAGLALLAWLERVGAEAVGHRRAIELLGTRAVGGGSTAAAALVRGRRAGTRGARVGVGGARRLVLATCRRRRR